MPFLSNPILLPFALLFEDPPAPDGPSMLFPFIAILGVFYFLLIRPESKRRKEHESMMGNLGKGDTVLTNGGIVGTISAVKENVISLQIADGVRIKVIRNSIQGIVDPNTGQMPGKNDKGGAKSKVKEEEDKEGEAPSS